jgi:hypothetical protein
VCLGSSADGRLLAYWHGYEVGIWELAGGEACSVLGGPLDIGLYSVDTSPDGRFMASASEDGVRMWDWSTLDQVAHLPVGDTKSAFFLRIDGALITATQSGLLRWPTNLDSESSTLALGPPEELDTSTPPAHRFLASGAANGNWIASKASSSDVHVFRWADPEDKVVLSSEAELENPIISPDGKWVVVGTRPADPGGAGYDVWDVHRGEVVEHLAHPAGPYVPIATFSPDGKWLVTGRGVECRFWEVGSWELRRSIGIEFRASGALAFSRDGGVLAVASSPRAIQLFDTATCRQLARLESAVPDNIWAICFNPEADKLAAACSNHVLLVWDLREIRRQLADMGLDWDQPPYPSPETPGRTEPLRVHVEMGDLQRN